MRVATYNLLHGVPLRDLAAANSKAGRAASAASAAAAQDASQAASDAAHEGVAPD